MIKPAILLLISVIAIESSPLAYSSVQDCDPIVWVECGIDIGECAVDCGWACISCVADSIKQCIGCLTPIDVINNIVLYKNDSGVHSKEKFSGVRTINSTVEGNCTREEWVKCGVTIAKCAFDCGKTCAFCIANTLLKCLSCIPAEDVMKYIVSHKNSKSLHGMKKFSGLKTIG